ncbi:MAG: DNA-processing protein DprA [Selenomonadaceae bacterium]
MLQEGYYLAAIMEAKGMSPHVLKQIVDEMGSAAAVWEQTNECAFAGNKRLRSAVAALKREKPNLPESIAESCERFGIAVTTIYDEDYPPILKEIFSPPMTLFYRGELWPHIQRVAMVGSRKASMYGKRVAEDISEQLARAGVTVVSGAARGIDTSSHIGAMKAGRTVAVLGCGLDIAYPPENRDLIDEIAERGAVISEYPPGTRPLAPFFPARNRIISGLSVGTIVVEAAKHSGSLITAELALSDGRDVFAVPGSIYSPTSVGCNHLIRQGAKLVETADDVLEEYSLAPAKPERQMKRGHRSTAAVQEADEAPASISLTKEEKTVYDLIEYDTPQTVDEIIFRLHGTGEASNISFILLQMALKGVIVEDENHAYIKVRNV